MGYSQTIPYQFLEFGGLAMSGDIWLDATGPIDVGDFTEPIPDFKGSVKLAYLDFVPGNLHNSHAGLNGINGNTYLRIKKAVGGTWTNALMLQSDSLRMEAAGDLYCGRIYGNLDVSSQIQAGKDILWQWHNADCLFDGLGFRGGTYIILRVYLA